jgi:hypothetical protein
MNFSEKRNITKKVQNLVKITGAKPEQIINIAKGMMKTYRYPPKVAFDVMKKQLIIHAAELHTTVKICLQELEGQMK